MSERGAHHGRLSELVEPPSVGRVFEHVTQPGFADCAPSGRVRLDALARWLQDVAYADVQDAGLEGHAVWVVRRTRIRVLRFPRFGEEFTIGTFCSGLGRMWAERRTTFTREGGEREVDALSIWVHLDREHWRPTPLTDDELAVYASAAQGRRVTARLRHPLPGSVDHGKRWRFRATEMDIAGHVNNAAYWEPLEEELLEGEEPAVIDVELEYRTPAQPGPKRVIRDGDRRWIVGDDGEMHASLLVAERTVG